MFLKKYFDFWHVFELKIRIELKIETIQVVVIISHSRGSSLLIPKSPKFVHRKCLKYLWIKSDET